MIGAITLRFEELGRMSAGAIWIVAAFVVIAAAMLSVAFFDDVDQNAINRANENTVDDEHELVDGHCRVCEPEFFQNNEHKEKIDA